MTKLFEFVKTPNWLVELLQHDNVVLKLSGGVCGVIGTLFAVRFFWGKCHFRVLSVPLSTYSSFVDGF